MLQNYLKLAWRQLTKNKLHSSINIGGLIVGFTIGIAILMVVYQQFSFDKFQVNRNRIYETYQVFNHPAKTVIENGFPMAQGPAYKAGAPGIEHMTRMLDGDNHIRYKGRDLSIPVMLVDADYFSMFSFPIVEGRQTNPLQNLNSIVLREDAAREIFGNEDPIGKTIKASTRDKMQDLVVTAVIKDGLATSFNFPALARIENISGYSSSSKDWEGRGMSLYVELKKGVTAREAEKQLIPIDRQHVPGWYDNLEKEGAKPDKYGDLWATRLLPLEDVHFSTEVNGHKAIGIGQILILLTVAVLIILIASFNFINISLAAAFTRSREMGIRKCLGAVKWKLFLQLWGESLLVCTISFLASLLLVNVLLNSIPSIEKIRIALSGVIGQPGFLLLALGLLLGVSLLAGGYPALMMTRFRIVETLKGRLNIKHKSPLRSSLIVFQFVIACIMISGTYIAWQQYRYLQNADTGIDKDVIVSVPLHDPAKGRETIEKLRVLLASDPHVVSVTGSNINLGRGSDHRTIKLGFGFTYKGRNLSTTAADVDYDYLKTLGIHPTLGRDFDKTYSTDTANKVVISESLARQLGTGDPIGQYLGADSSWSGWQVIGVFPDFHLYSLAEKQEPLMLLLDPHATPSYCFIRTTGHNTLATMSAIKKRWQPSSPARILMEALLMIIYTTGIRKNAPCRYPSDSPRSSPSCCPVPASWPWSC
ncbi:MAG TPA: ABC transporter permease [Puia sp.]|nr:ABC transporter permease [Puia sp.]